LAQFLPALPLIGGGKTRFQPVYVGDVADAVMAALDDPETAGRTYELGGPRIYTFKALMAFILAETRRKRLLMLCRGRRLACRRPPAASAQSAADPRPGALARAGQRRLARRRTLTDLGITPETVEAIVPPISTAIAAAAGSTLIAWPLRIPAGLCGFLDGKTTPNSYSLISDLLSYEREEMRVPIS